MVNVNRLDIIKRLKLLSFLSSEEIDLICEIVNTLEEPNVQLIERIVHRLGVDSCRDLLKETINILESGGLRKSDGFKRTSGGVFIALVKKQIDKNTIKFIWREQNERQKQYKSVKRRNISKRVTK